MNIFQLRFVNIGFLFLLIFASGFWLNHSGKPYGTILFNLHKLIGFGTLVFLAVKVYQFNQTVPLSPMEWLTCIIAGLVFLVTIVFGGLVSIGKPMPVVVSLMHKLFPYLTALSTTLSLFLLLRHK